MNRRFRLHVFLPEDEDGFIPPTNSDELDECAVEGLFSDYFTPSSYGLLRNDQVELVSEIFELQEDDLETVNKLKKELRDLYPGADVLQTHDTSPDRDGPEWEYSLDIIILVANVQLNSPPIRWTYSADISEKGLRPLFGKQFTPPGAAANGHIALTDGRDLCGVNIDSGEVTWSIGLLRSAYRSPVSINQTLVVELETEHKAYDIASGECLWTVEEIPCGTTTTRHTVLDEYCYFGDFEGCIWELSSTGNYQLITNLKGRIIGVYPTEEYVYALKGRKDESGRTPETLHAIDRKSGEEEWVFSPEEKLERAITASSNYVWVSTHEEMVALHSESGDIAWTKSSIELGSDEENENTNTGNNNLESDSWQSNNLEEAEGPHSIDWGIQNDGEYEAKIKKLNHWASGSSYGRKLDDKTFKTVLNARPVLDEALFAPTNRGLLQVDPASGEVGWKALAKDNLRPSAVLGPFSPPTQDENHIYIGDSETVYSVDKQTGEIIWEFEIPGSPGTMTFDLDTESLTFVTRGLAINVGLTDSK